MEQTSVPLTVLVDASQTLSLQFAYDRQHFDAGVVKQLAGHLQHLLLQMADSSEQAEAWRFALAGRCATSTDRRQLERH